MRDVWFRYKNESTGRWVKNEICNILDSIELDYSIDLNTVGEWTGKFDKTGTMIFEGDICEFYAFDGRLKCEGIVSYYDSTWQLSNARIKENADIDIDWVRSEWENICMGFYLHKIMTHNIKIVGNIHEAQN